MDKTSPVYQFIRRTGTDRLADVTGRTRGAVNIWAHKGSIPRDVWPELVLAIPEVSLESLLEMEPDRT